MLYQENKPNHQVRRVLFMTEVVRLRVNLFLHEPYGDGGHAGREHFGRRWVERRSFKVLRAGC